MKKIRMNMFIISILIVLIFAIFPGCFEENNNKQVEEKENIIIHENFQLSLSLAEDWLISNLKEKGCFNYIYDPVTDEYSTSNNMIRQLMASRVLAEMSQKDNSLIYLHEKNLDFIFKYWYFEDNDIGYIYYNDKSKLGAIAMAIRTLVYSPLFDDYQSEVEKLANCILFLQNDNGSFEPWYIEPDYSYDKDYLLTFYSGEAILSLVELYLKTNNNLYLDAAILSQDYYLDIYVEHLNENYYPAYVPWHTQSLNKLYKITKQEKYAEAVLILNDKLLEIQDTENNETLGRFYNSMYPEYGSPHSSSDGVYTEGLVYAYEIADLFDDKIHMDIYLAAIRLGVHNLISLQYNKSNSELYSNPDRIIGGIQINIDNPRLRIDTTQHTLDAYHKIVEIFYN